MASGSPTGARATAIDSRIAACGRRIDIGTEYANVAHSVGWNGAWNERLEQMDQAVAPGPARGSGVRESAKTPIA
jgi:hypothetical protein